MPAKKKKTTAKKPAPKAPVTKTTTAKKSQPVGPREQKIASSALKLVDQAAALLRQGIHTTANTTEQNRLEAKKKAHALLTKATSSLTDVLSGSASALHKVIGKL